MSGPYRRALTVVATVGSGLAAGVFFAISTSLAAAILFVVALVAARRSETTSTSSRPVGEHAGAADLVESGVPR
jgi:hypothetical protein